MFVNIVQFPKIKQQEMPNSDDGSWTRMMLTQSTLVSSAEFYCSRETAENYVAVIEHESHETFMAMHTSPT